ncbi:jg9837 [Pararge aegeria aegeria]|uniref:Jg9837 protein n=1 Tax=Pararge aegeria aegeria TaxID=348720 RepID=A0A8S4RSE6_9NEOP|nr:jg9837 [Pararge aegeria aegeria]
MLDFTFRVTSSYPSTSEASTVKGNIVRKPACQRDHVLKGVWSPPFRNGPAWWTTALNPSNFERRPLPCRDDDTATCQIKV